MTYLLNDPTDFADEALAGFAASNSGRVQGVHGGVVRATETPARQVAVVMGGGSGHFPAFAGWVGVGLGSGAACGNIFASPSESQIYAVAKAADNGGGILFAPINYAGDILNFGAAAERLRGEGIDVRMTAITDDIASGPRESRSSRRGIAGCLLVLKIVGAAAEQGLSLDEVERIAIKAIAATDTLGVAFSGCTLPGADAPLFTIPSGRMAVGLGIHGEPGISEVDLGTTDEVADLLIDGLLAERPQTGGAIGVLVNGLGAVKYDELFAVYNRVHRRLSDKGFRVVAPVVGEQVTSLDMAGLSLSITYLDDELEQLWTAPTDTPAFSRGASSPRSRRDQVEDAPQKQDVVGSAGEGSRSFAASILGALEAADVTIAQAEHHLGDLDAVAGDGDHGIGMKRGVTAAVVAARQAVALDAGAGTLLRRAADAWSARAGGTSGALWGASLAAMAEAFGDEQPMSDAVVVRGVGAFATALQERGGAQPGDKTMVDAVLPFVRSLEKLHSEGASLREAWTAAALAATAGAEATAEFGAKLGRSRIHGDKSIGTPDAGAVSFALIVTAICN